jgi:hypothetical protein
MSAIKIRDLAQSRQLDRPAMAAVRGGFREANSWLAGLGPVANVNVGINVEQSNVQFQNVDVAALNNVGVIGADLGPLHLNVSPTQRASNAALF